MEGTSVGKINLELEVVNSDIQGQIEKAANELGNVLQDAFKGFDATAILKGINDTFSEMKTMTERVLKELQDQFSRAKFTVKPEVDQRATPKVVNPSARATGPPIDISSLELKAENIAAKMDLLDVKAVKARNSVKELSLEIEQLSKPTGSEIQDFINRDQITALTADLHKAQAEELKLGGQLDELNEKYQNIVNKIEQASAKSVVPKIDTAPIDSATTSTVKFSNELAKTATRASMIKPASNAGGIADTARQAAQSVTAVNRVTEAVQRVKNTANNSGGGGFFRRLAEQAQESANQLRKFNPFPIREVSNETRRASSEMRRLGTASTSAGRQGVWSMQSLSRAISSSLRSFLVLRVIGQLLRGLTSEINSAFMTSEAFRGALGNLRLSLYQAFYPIYEAVLPALVTLINVIAKAISWLGALISMLFGKTVEASQAGGTALMGAVDAMNGVGSAADGAGTSAGQAADDVEEAAERIQGSLAGFDQLNVLQIPEVDDPNKGSTGGGGGKAPGGGGGGGNAGAIIPDYSHLTQETPAWVKKLQDLFDVLFKPLKEAWARDGELFMKNFKDAIDTTKRLLSEFYEMLKHPAVQEFMKQMWSLAINLGSVALRMYSDFVAPIISWFIKSIPEAVEHLNPFLEKLNNKLRELAQPGFGAEMLDYVIRALDAAKGHVIAFFDVLNTDSFWNFAGAMVEFGQRLAMAALNIYTNFVAPIIQWFIQSLPEAMDILTPFIEGVNQRLSDLMHPDVGTEAVQNVINALDNIKEALKPFMTNVGEGLLWFYDNVLKPLAGWTISNLVPAFLDLIAAGLNVLISVIEALKPLWKWLWDNFFKPLAEWTGGVILNVLAILTDLLNGISNWINSHQKAVEIITTLLLGFAAAWVVVHGAILAFTAISTIATTALAILGGAIAFLTSPIGIIITVVGLLVAAFIYWQRNQEELSLRLEKIWLGMQYSFEIVVLGIKMAIQLVIDGFKEMLNWLYQKFLGGLYSIVEPINGIYEAITGKPIEGLEKLKQASQEKLFETGQEFDGLKQAVKDAGDKFQNETNRIDGELKKLAESTKTNGQETAGNFLDSVTQIENAAGASEKAGWAVNKSAQTANEGLNILPPAFRNLLNGAKEASEGSTAEFDKLSKAAEENGRQTNSSVQMNYGEAFEFVKGGFDPSKVVGDFSAVENAAETSTANAKKSTETNITNGVTELLKAGVPIEEIVKNMNTMEKTVTETTASTAENVRVTTGNMSADITNKSQGWYNDIANSFRQSNQSAQGETSGLSTFVGTTFDNLYGAIMGTNRNITSDVDNSFKENARTANESMQNLRTGAEQKMTDAHGAMNLKNIAINLMMTVAWAAMYEAIKKIVADFVTALGNYTVDIYNHQTNMVKKCQEALQGYNFDLPLQRTADFVTKTGNYAVDIYNHHGNMVKMVSEKMAAWSYEEPLRIMADYVTRTENYTAENYKNYQNMVKMISDELAGLSYETALNNMTNYVTRVDTHTREVTHHVEYMVKMINEALPYINWNGALNEAANFVTRFGYYMEANYNHVANMVNMAINKLYEMEWAFANVRMDIRGAVNGAIAQANWGQQAIAQAYIAYAGGYYNPYATSTIPYLARGGLIDQPTLAMIGEGQHEEVVVPLDKDSQAQKKIADMILANMKPQEGSGGNGGNGGTTVIQVVLDGEVITEKVISNVKEKHLRTGRDPLKV